MVKENRRPQYKADSPWSKGIIFAIIYYITYGIFCGISVLIKMFISHRDEYRKAEAKKAAMAEGNIFDMELSEGETAIRIQHPDFGGCIAPDIHPLYQAAIREYVEYNNESDREHIIERWDAVLCNGKWKDPSRIAIISDGQKYVCEVEYSTHQAKDGNPRVEKLYTRDFVLDAKPQKKLSQDTLNKAMLNTLNAPEMIAYCESANNKLLQTGEAVFNACIALKMTEEEFIEKYGTEEHIIAWKTALSERFGNGLENPAVEQTGIGLFEIKAMS